MSYEWKDNTECKFQKNSHKKWEIMMKINNLQKTI